MAQAASSWLGEGGGRLDHLLAIRAIFERRPDSGRPRPAEWHTAAEEIFLVEAGKSVVAEAVHGGIVSVFPLEASAHGMSSSGLKWPLSGLSWGPGDFGVSNVAISGRFSVEAGAGDLLLVIERSRAG